LEIYDDGKLKKDIDYSLNLVKKMIKIKEMEKKVRHKINLIHANLNSFDSDNHIIKNEE
jgi:hypothetical protein